MPIVVDGEFFLRRLGHRYPGLDRHSPKDVAVALMYTSAAHIAFRSGFDPAGLIGVGDNGRELGMAWAESEYLYRVFFYDCPPLEKRAHLPISKQAIDLSKSDVAVARRAIHRELQAVRKVALRLGRLNEKFGWRLKSEATLRCITANQPIIFTDNDFEVDVVQKGVDMKLGLDVAAMAIKRQVDQIVLIAADADFVPATKLARREGIDVVLDPMGATPAHDLLIHVDGIRDMPKQRVAAR